MCNITDLNNPYIPPGLIPSDGTLSSITATSFGYSGGTEHPNGHIYLSPRNQTNLHKLDVSTNTISILTATLPGGHSVFGHGVPYGDFIYYAPCNTDRVIKYDVINDSFIEIGPSISTTVNLSGTLRYLQTILADNGKIYGVPNNVDAVVEIDPSNDTVVLYPFNFSPTVFATKWFGGVVIDNTTIAFITHNFKLRYFDTNTQVFSSEKNAPSPIGGPLQFYGGVKVNDSIYFTPYRTNYLAVFNITNDNYLSAIPTPTTGTTKWAGAVVKDDYIYCAGYGNNNILAINTLDNTMQLIPGNSGFYQDVLLHSNGNIYFINFVFSPSQQFHIKVLSFN